MNKEELKATSQSNSVTATKYADYDYSEIEETKTFYPSVDEFSSPLKYIQSIRDEGLKYGIIKIKPPKEWTPHFNLSFDDFKFSSKVQPIHMLEKRVPGGSLSSFSLAEIRCTFLENLRLFLGDANIDNVIINRKKVYLYDLYKKVTLYGGHHRINKDALWKNVGTELGVEYRGNTNLTASNVVKLCYETYLLHYEETHNFGSTAQSNDINISAKQKYKALLAKKAQQIGKIKSCATSNLSDVNQWQSCSVCGQFESDTNLISECTDCGNRFHSKCHKPAIPIHHEAAWCCSGCDIQKSAKFGYEPSSKTYSLNQYQRKAQQFKDNFVAAHALDLGLAETEWENIFWSIVDNGCHPLCVEYGSEIPSKPEMTGFPMEDVEDALTAMNYGSHAFNLMNIKHAAGNILKHLERDISGMTYPWIYVGMLFTSFGWHYEDHYAYSVNYNHVGAVKQWYGIPALSADLAERAMNSKQFLDGKFEQFDLVTLVSPLVLHKQYNVPIYKARQNAGEFVITFPQAYHCGFNLGFNVAEAVNFCTADWLSFGLKCAERYKLFGRRHAFAHNELVCNLCAKLEVLDLATLKWLFESFVFVYKSHYEFIETMLSANVTRGRMWQYDAAQWVKPKADDEDTADGTGRMEGEDTYLDEVKYEDAECAKCHSCLYIACVRCQCDPSQVCCHQHFAQFCDCPVANKWFEFRFSLTWFEEILRALTSKVNAVYVDNEYNGQELFTDGSGKNYEILSKSTDAGIVNIACNTTMRGMREAFIDRFGQILGGYTNELVRKLQARFPKLSSNVLSQEELSHLCHACECVVWANFADADTNSNLVEVRRYFEILCDYNNVAKILMDTFTNYSNVQSFYNKLQELQGEYDKIQLQILLQNQPRFPKKLSMAAIEVALQRAQNNEIKVEMAQILHKMPSILSFMHQQQEILQNALNGILTTTWANKQSLIGQARSIVNFIPGNFADSYWRYLGNKNIVNSKTNAINKSTCLVLPILSWLLNEFERGILGSIDCDAMNTIKRVISKGNMIQLQINKFCAKESDDCWLTQSELEHVIKTCGDLHLRLPFYDLMKMRYEKYNEWDAQTLRILNKEEKCSYAVINALVRQYSQNRIFNKNGDILKIKFLAPMRKWINNAKALLDGNVSQCHDLIIEFEQYAEIMDDTPKEYELLLEYVGISEWINSVETQLKYNNHNMEQLAQFIENGKHFNIKKTVKLIALLRERLDKLQRVYAQCEDQFVCIQNKEKTYDLSQYHKLMQTAQDLHIDIEANHKLMQIRQHIVAVEEWETYLQNKISKLLSKNANNNNKNSRKRTYSEFDENHDSNQQNKYLNGAYKRRKQNDSSNTDTFWWKTAMNGYCFESKPNQILTQRQDENDIIDSIQELLEKSLLIAAKSPLENTAKLMLNNIRECMIECNRFIDKTNEDVAVLIDIDLDEIVTIKENVQLVQALSNTLIEFKINTLHWRWHAMHYLNGINNNESDWDLAKLFSEGNRLGLNNDNKEWQKISAMYEDLALFDSVCLDLFVSGNADCKMLLLLNEKIKNKQNALNIVNIIRHCIDDKYMNNLDVAISQIAKISERIEIFSDFYDKNFISSILSYSNLEILSSEMGLLAQCLNVDSIPHFNSIKSTDVYMENILTKLDNLYWDRPHGDKCDLVKWINFSFMQFNIMYCNNGIIQMDKYRLNAGNHCYCFCRFTYTVSMKEKNEPIPEMIGCEECAEWYHAECIMLDDKQMRKFFNSKRLKFICPRCCYYEYNDCYKYFPSLHWNQMELVKLSDLENVLANNGDAGDVILCHCPVINGVNRLISWIKIWQMDVNNFMNVICLTHNVLSDFSNEEVFITEYLLNCGQICGIFTLELLSLKILQRFIGKSTIYNNHNGARQLSLHEIELSFTQQLLRKYEAKSKLLNDFILTTCNDIENSKKILYEVYMDLYFIKAVGIHYITYMRRKKKGPLKVKLILRRLNTLIKLDLSQCPKLLHDKDILDEKGDNYVNEEFTSHDTEWLKYVNESVSMKKSDKKQCKAKWAERLNAHKSNLMDKYKNSRLRIQSVVITLDLIDKLVEG